MKIIKPSVELVNPVSEKTAMLHLEMCGRVCYKSEDKTADGSAETFLRNIIKRGHEAVLEHINVTLKFTCDRGVSHELVRHRLASYCQESTRYCNYANEKFGRSVAVIEPSYLRDDPDAYMVWQSACNLAENAYFTLLDLGRTPQEARAVLPNSLKTEVMMTANIREWRHFLKLRCAPAAHPQMREVALMALSALHEQYPVLFEDIYREYHE